MWYTAGSLMLHRSLTSPLTAQPSTTFHHHPIELSIALERTVQNIYSISSSSYAFCITPQFLITVERTY
ncbi:hypothetical protein K503DRAFT_770362 [Rhizopogon vinicolor AM-OR11-026]|uniref:Uncharacterized protein n=1 Tax=Rhizopogon vinicolor AM-OR11-026 TaxID=1314800 RepID=A0A1B7N0Z7_9AGAM|nr:hypothetical protein K503DRAFT_770362 [Rhizopogon vinicolor AM-OR11-026]